MVAGVVVGGEDLVGGAGPRPGPPVRGLSVRVCVRVSVRVCVPWQ